MADETEKASPLSVRLTHEAMDLMRFAVMAPDSGYDSLADFVREAVEEKLEREETMERYETVRKALKAYAGKDAAKMGVPAFANA